MRHVSRVMLVTLITAGVALGASGCAGIELPERTNLPEITLPTAFPTRDSGDGPGSEGEADPPAEQEPAPEEPEPNPEPEAVPEPDDAADITWWLVGLAGVAIAVIVIVVARRARAARQWDDNLESVRRDLRWLDQALVPEILSKATAADASATWQAARPRVLKMDEDLFALQTAERDDERTARAAGDLSALRTLVQSIDAETSTLEPANAQELRARRAAVEHARSVVRARFMAESR